MHLLYAEHITILICYAHLTMLIIELNIITQQHEVKRHKTEWLNLNLPVLNIHYDWLWWEDLLSTVEAFKDPFGSSTKGILGICDISVDHSSDAHFPNHLGIPIISGHKVLHLLTSLNGFFRASNNYISFCSQFNITSVPFRPALTAHWHYIPTFTKNFLSSRVNYYSTYLKWQWGQ